MDQREERSHQAKPHSIYNCSKDGVSPVVEPVDQKVSRKEGTTGEITQLPGGKGSEKRLRNKMQWDQGKCLATQDYSMNLYLRGRPAQVFLVCLAHCADQVRPLCENRSTPYSESKGLALTVGMGSDSASSLLS